MAAGELDRQETLRYSRHLLMPEVGVAGQRKLKAGRVLVVGAGGLGAPLSLYLAAAGVGRIGVVDFDCVDYSNLQRQILYSDADVGQPKLAAAVRRLQAANPHIEVIPHEVRLSSENAESIAAGYDILVDGTDNFATRYLVNDICVLLGKTNVYGSIYRFDGQASVFDARRGPCYRCLYPQPPPPGLVPSCAEGGVLGILPGIVGLIQAAETIKLLLGVGESLVGRLLLFDALGMTFRELTLEKNADCPICGSHPTIRTLQDYEVLCGTAPAATAGASAGADPAASVTAPELKALLDAGRAPRLIDVREPHEYEICRIEGATLLPLSTLPETLHSLDTTREIVLYCHHGVRSQRAFAILRDAGFQRLRHLTGGIDAWAELVEPGMARY